MGEGGSGGVMKRESNALALEEGSARPTGPRILKVPSSREAGRTAEGGHPSKINREGAAARNLN